MSTVDAPRMQEIAEFSDRKCLTNQPLVSVLMMAYNHGEYIADAIEGVMSQQVDFEYELLIGEDRSVDDTLKIAMEFQCKFPHLIRIVTSEENVGPYSNIRRLFARARGEFIAFCEGDDLWCAPDKLARQVALLSGDTGAGAVHSNWVRMKLVRGQWVVKWNNSVHRRVPSRLLEGGLFATFYFPKLLRTCTVMYRRSLMEEYYASLIGTRKYRFGDAAMAAFMTSRLRVAYIPDVTAVYRLSPFSLLRSGRAARVEHMMSSLEFDSDARRYFCDRADYPTGYRWESSVGLLLWALVALDVDAVRLAMKDIRQHFGVVGFFKDARKSVNMRWPSLRGLR